MYIVGFRHHIYSTAMKCLIYSTACMLLLCLVIKVADAFIMKHHRTPTIATHSSDVQHFGAGTLANLRTNSLSASCELANKLTAPSGELTNKQPGSLVRSQVRSQPVSSLG